MLLIMNYCSAISRVSNNCVCRALALGNGNTGWVGGGGG